MTILTAKWVGGFFVLFVGLFMWLNYFVFLSLVKASDTGSVAATVTAQNISLSVSDGGVVYGTLGVGSTKKTTSIPSGGIDDSQIIENTGNVAEAINIRGIDSVPASGVGWTLASNPGSDVYSHKFCTVDCDSSPTWIPLGLGNTELSASLGVGETKVFDMQIYTPVSTTGFAQQDVSVTVQASTL